LRAGEQVRLLRGPAPVLERSEVHVWTFDLDQPSLAGLGAPGQRFSDGRGALRHLLGWYLDEAPSALSFTHGRNGKPALAGRGRHRRLRFSVARAARLGVLAMADDREVGVDVERISSARASLRIADAFFSPREAAVLRRLPASSRARAFFTYWTRKEAYLKATGEGLSGLEGFDMARGASGWWLSDLVLAEGYAAALAVHGAECRLRLFAGDAGEGLPRETDSCPAQP
jgi:4'-phosphopantetheinyl transferase